MITNPYLRLVFGMIVVAVGSIILLKWPSHASPEVLDIQRSLALPLCPSDAEALSPGNANKFEDEGEPRVYGPPVCVIDGICGIFGTTTPGCQTGNGNVCAQGLLQPLSSTKNASVVAGSKVVLSDACEAVAEVDVVNFKDAEARECMEQCKWRLGKPPWLGTCLTKVPANRVCFKLWSATWLKRLPFPLSILMSLNGWLLPLAYLVASLGLYAARRAPYYYPLPTLALEEEAMRSTFWIGLSVGSAIADPVLDIASLVQFLQQGQPFYAGLTFVAMIGGFLDVLQQGLLQHSEESLKRGFLTKGFMQHQVTEGLLEGLIGGNIALWSLVTIPPEKITMSASIAWSLSSLSTYAMTFPGAIQASWVLNAQAKKELNLDSKDEVKKFKADTAVSSRLFASWVLMFSLLVPFGIRAYSTNHMVAGTACLGMTLIAIIMISVGQICDFTKWLWSKSPRAAACVGICFACAVSILNKEAFQKHFSEEQWGTLTHIVQSLALCAIALGPVLLHVFVLVRGGGHRSSESEASRGEE